MIVCERDLVNSSILQHCRLLLFLLTWLFQLFLNIGWGSGSQAQDGDTECSEGQNIEVFQTRNMATLKEKRPAKARRPQSGGVCMQTLSVSYCYMNSQCPLKMVFYVCFVWFCFVSTAQRSLTCTVLEFVSGLTKVSISPLDQILTLINARNCKCLEERIICSLWVSLELAVMLYLKPFSSSPGLILLYELGLNSVSKTSQKPLQNMWPF